MRGGTLDRASGQRLRGVGLKPFLPDSGTWSVAGSVLTIRRPARRETVTLETEELSGTTLSLKRTSGDLVMTAQ